MARERERERGARFFFLTENFLRETNSWESERQSRNCACIARKRFRSRDVLGNLDCEVLPRSRYRESG